MKFLLLISLLFFLVSCGSENAVVAPDSTLNLTAIPRVEPKRTGNDPYPILGGAGPSQTAGSVPGAVAGPPMVEQNIILPLSNGVGNVEFNLKTRTRALVRFEAAQGQEIIASISQISGDVSGYQLTQIVSADGVIDGPYGSSLSYSVPRSGTYGLRIAPTKSDGIAGAGRIKLDVKVR